MVSLRSDLDKLGLASVLAESVDMLLRDESEHDTSVYESFLLGLKALEEEKALGELLRSTFYALSQILCAVGISHMEDQDKPSPKSLMTLIKRIEDFSERRMKTRQSLEDILRHFQKQKAIPGESGG